jgi:hypothetical protein
VVIDLRKAKILIGQVSEDLKSGLWGDPMVVDIL